jgi:phenylacetate-coenzyme A ligase PaaK-like adenylate-forming protein
MRGAQFCRNLTPLKELKLVVLSSEYIDTESMTELEQIFGCPVVREYGAIETGIIAADFPGSPLRIMEHRLLVETLPRKDGMYDILVTCLDNPYYPLFRYRLEDLTSAPMVIPDRGAAHLTDILGRVNDLLMMPDGKWLHSAYVTQAIRAVVPAKRFQIVQEKPDHLHIRLETARALTAAEKERIHSRIFLAFHQGVRITIAENERFETTPKGKHKFVIRHGGFHP